MSKISKKKLKSQRKKKKKKRNLKFQKRFKSSKQQDLQCLLMF